jgi:crossover junction endodeoxyribonuclease RuvC
MPKQGVASSFTFGMGYGIWLGVVAAFQIAYTQVTPQRWTKLLLADMVKGDSRAVLRAAQLYPAFAGQLRTKRGALELGRADALLLAHYGKVTAASTIADAGPETVGLAP